LITLLINATVQISRRSGNTAESAVESGGHYRGLRVLEGVVEKQPDRAAVWTFQEAEAVGGSEAVSFNSRVNGKANALQQ
jgi:hypothetical protein